MINRQGNDVVNRYDDVSFADHVIMPHRIHGIVFIDKRTGASPVPTVSNIVGAFKTKEENERRITPLVPSKPMEDRRVENVIPRT